MRKNDKKIFLDQNKLLRMIALRRAGYATTSLAILFGVDRSSIEYHCQRLQLRPETATYTLERIISEVIEALQPSQDLNYRIINGEKINLGKSYAEYIADQKLIPIAKQSRTYRISV